MNSSDTPELKGEALHVLLALTGGPLHGYGILLEAEARSGGEVQLQTGPLYRTLKRLLDDRLIEECGAPAGTRSEDARRRYYRLTAPGRRALSAEAERMERLAHAIRAAAHGKRKPLT
jgi:PadR family transcriptional regulator, regulatory protein PadR